MQNLIIRRYLFGDEKGIIELFQEVFKKPMGKTESINHWNWEYKDNPNSRIEILLVIDNKKIVGHYAVIPVKMKIKKKIYLTSLSLDTMTHKDYRGMGIFPKLATKMYNELGNSGIYLTYGFPNEYSINGFLNKLDWFEISKIPIYIFPLNFKNIIYHFIKNKLISNLIGNIWDSIFTFFIKKKVKKSTNIIKIKEFDNRFNNLWDLVKKEIIIGVVRDKSYLNWRYFQKPEEKYKVFAIKSNDNLKGYIILKIEKRFNLRIGLIMDILTDPSDISYQEDLIKYAIKYFGKKKVDIISVIMFPHCSYFKFLKKKGFIKVIKFLFPEKIYFGARINNDKLNSQIIKNPRNWFLTWGDTDVV